MMKRARQQPARPRDAASLVIVRERRGHFEVLMGRRTPGDRFLPDVFVFPGGRVDPVDSRTGVERELSPRVLRRMPGSLAPSRARALAVAAIRETFEETGLVFGRRRGAALEPDLGALDYIARAITPAQSPIRYNARFFLAHAQDATGRLAGSGELLDLHWSRFDAAADLPIIDVTRFVLDEVEKALVPAGPRRRPALIYYRMGAAHRRSE
jgi:8-oxo-dGTP pyrophosphatase MutT (NUDIX family)